MNTKLRPLVSVCIPSFNHSSYVLECLESIYESDYDNLELVIIDDGSTDNSSYIIREWIKIYSHRFQNTVFKQQNNSGICITLNRLVDTAKGEFIVFIASDDRLLGDGISLRVSKLESNPTWLAVYGDCKLISSNGQLISDSAISYLYKANKRALLCSSLIARELILNWSVPGPGFMARKICFDEKNGAGRYNEDLKFEDRDFYLRLLARKAIGYVDHPVAEYRVHSLNVSRAPKAIKYTPASIKAITDANIKLSNSFHDFNKVLLKLDNAYTFYTLHYLVERQIYLLIPRLLIKSILLLAYRTHSLAINLLSR